MKPHRPCAWTTGCIIRVTAASPARMPICVGAVRCPFFLKVSSPDTVDTMKEETDHEERNMSEMKIEIDYAGMAHAEIRRMNEKRGLVAAELSEIKAELAFGYAELEEPREVRHPEARAEMQGTRETPGEAA